ncbi:MAG: cystathionine beta-lyase [Myxococcales bacterium]|nr:cystathionine beta-lyase [Myxococcales bacterium]
MTGRAPRRPKRVATTLAHGGRHPELFDGAVNTPVVRASTILSPSLAEWEAKLARMLAGEPGTYYGRFGTATSHGFEEAVTQLERGHGTIAFPSGYAACAAAILSQVSTGSHVLLPDSVYFPVRKLASGLLARMGVVCTFYDPTLTPAALADLLRAETRLVYLEAPGSLTFEMQDVPGIAALCRSRGVSTAMDNTWATPLCFRPLEHGVDLSVQAATQYVVGHSDAMLGYVACGSREVLAGLRRTHEDLGYATSPDDAFLGARGLRTLEVRLERQGATGLALADELARAPEVERVLHPARPDDPGHALWKRDFSGACGLFGVVFEPLPRAALEAFVDALELFGIGASWGGYESLVMPMDPARFRTATRWSYGGPCLRFHAGLEDPSDLLDDVRGALAALRRAR